MKTDDILKHNYDLEANNDFKESAIIAAANGEAQQRLTAWKADIIAEIEGMKGAYPGYGGAMEDDLEGDWLFRDEVLTLLKGNP